MSLSGSVTEKANSENSSVGEVNTRKRGLSRRDIHSLIGTLTGQSTEFFFFPFREVDADSSNCNFTIRFLIRIHGLPPGSINPSSVIVLVSKRVGQ